MSTIRHKVFGEGIVKTVDNGYIEIDFNGQMKKFLFPKAFEEILTTEDEDLLQKLTEAKGNTAQDAKAAAEKKSVIPSSIITSSSRNSRSYKGSFTHSINHPLIGERAQTIAVRSEEEMFELVGYMVSPYRVSSVEAEVPKDGRDAIFEEIFPGQIYRPIKLGETPSGMSKKFSPQFRINFSNLRNCPEILLRNMGKGTGSCVGRINKSKFVIDLVQNYGFRFGEMQDVSAIRNIAQKRGFIDAFEQGYRR